MNLTIKAKECNLKYDYDEIEAILLKKSAKDKDAKRYRYNRISTSTAMMQEKIKQSLTANFFFIDYDY